MDFLPKASGVRPRVACEIAPQGVVAGRADAPGAPLAAVSCVGLREGALTPGLKPGNLTDRVALVGALRRALEQVGGRPNGRNAEITLVIPDSACRVLLLDFDALPNKLSEALPLVRFRLKKLVPFDADEAMVSFQIMSQSKQLVRVLAVAIPRDVLSEYESAAREAGFEPGAVLPSTLAAMAAVDDASPSLLVNASPLGITTAIAREGILLLHRTVDLQREPSGIPANLPPALLEPTLPLVDREETAGEWARQEPLPEHGRNSYAERAAAEAAVQNEDGVVRQPLPDIYAAGEPAPVTRSPYVSPVASAELNAEIHNAILNAPTSIGTLTETPAPGYSATTAPPTTQHVYAPVAAQEFSHEVAQAVSVAAAYYEDNLAATPSVVLSAGSLGAAGLQRILEEAGMADGGGLRVRELVDAAAVGADTVSARVPRGMLAGVLGALRS